jgi:hypothetical protein
MECGNDSAFPFIRSIGNSLTKRRGFEHESKTGNVIKIGGGHWSGAKAAMVVGDNKPLGNKPIYRFT